MTGSIGAPSREAPAAKQDAADFLAEGLPINLTPLSARAYAERCQAAVEALDPVESLLAVKLLTAGIVAAAHAPSGDANLTDLVQQADDTQAIAERLGDEASIAYAGSRARPRAGARRKPDSRHGDASQRDRARAHRHRVVARGSS